MEPVQAAYDYWLKPLTDRDMVEISTEWLAGDFEGELLARVAGAVRSDDPRDVREWFVAVLEGLDVWIPDWIAAVEVFAHGLAVRLRDGDTTITQAQQLLRARLRPREAWDFDGSPGTRRFLDALYFADSDDDDGLVELATNVTEENEQM